MRRLAVGLRSRACMAVRPTLRAAPALRWAKNASQPVLAKRAVSGVTVSPGVKVEHTPTLDQHEHRADNHEIKDPEVIFKLVLNGLREKRGEENLNFPKDIMWLAGAPGAGKGKMTPFIQEQRGVSAPPLEVSHLLNSPEAKEMKAAGKLVGDRQVIELLFDALLRPEYQSGVIVDGFPRTVAQAECIKLLFNEMMHLRRKYEGTKHCDKFRRPIFHITVLFVDQEESVRRQLSRGRKAKGHNDMVLATGVGELMPVRDTDFSEALARERYRQFKEQVYGSLQAIKEKFHFHFINAEGGVAEVQDRILHELSYQSAMELGDDTFERVRQVPLATDIVLNARHELVKRLDRYKREHADTFDKVITVVRNEFAAILKRQALAGRAIIRSQNQVFAQAQALDIALDVLSERGFVVVLDYQKQRYPESVDLKTGKITHAQRNVYEFQIEWQRPNIRRG